jgi:hypothetical protein
MEEKGNTLKGYALVNINTKSLSVKRSLQTLKNFRRVFQMTKGSLTTSNEWKLNANNPVGVRGKAFCMYGTKYTRTFLKISPSAVFVIAFLSADISHMTPPLCMLQTLECRAGMNQ